METLIKKLDIFGTGFEFTTFKHSKFQTLLGASFTIVCLIIIIVFSFLFGRDFYFRQNPRVLAQIKVPDNYSEPFVMNTDNFLVAWRISDTNSKKVDFTGYLYPILTH